MLVAAAVCPCPPLLVPEVAVGAAPELDGLRAACDEAVRTVLAARPEVIVVVGPGETSGTGVVPYAQGAPGTFRPYGVALDVSLGLPPDVTVGDAGPEAPGDRLPLSLAVGAWLLDRAGLQGPVRGLQVPDDADPAANAATGAELARLADRVGLLVMGDGSACRGVKAPGYLDERAADVDARIAAALGGAGAGSGVDVGARAGAGAGAGADAGAGSGGFLAELDAALARELMISGRSPWQVLGGASAGDLTGRLLYDEAPYGVGYFVASWA
ncbi:class III extradiol dioxygenase subunit B-like domain-containing protein [Streptomyces sp. NPDC091292]|uniref:class III extradiol dioxygenase subunit B-like domain-containing protein n=1 Tax=Streptomyces sp. NPDC091292 TaxID=3365991 RepID=UPI0038206CA2